MPESAPVAARDTDALDAALRPGGLRPAFQPIVDLADGRPVGYEALARGLPGAALARPDQLFAAARAAGRLVELDWACRLAALECSTALDTTLFVNVEPEALGETVPSDVRDRVRALARGRDVVVELTERALASRPAELLQTVDRLRERGLGVAVDDIGAETSSLALLPLLAPDVVKLDLRLVQQRPTRELATIVNAVRAHRERTGAQVIAEGIETEEHREVARAVGATLGQGWLFGRPGPLPAEPVAGRVPRVSGTLPVAGATPYDVVRRVRPVERSTKPLLLAMSDQLEEAAESLDRDVVVLSAFQTAERFTPATARRYERLAARAAFVGALGVDLPAEPARGVRGGRLPVPDRLADEWSVVVVGHHFAAALVARDLGDDGPEAQRRFDFAVTHDRDLAVAAAATLLRRIEPID
ncbi:EAL domain-containing protein [Conexibacter sp. JD483]|uniref:sensor domain-containing phosphodiesterase n=1 Tax=unclassified Conexibacter TaxID=2627773 RepID=UPI00272484AA|nr:MULTISPECIES: EAL domain-containing protein [unclassified Conexibacter]MDO8187959.1 EAL domain-containing protein [Conexibacter sp. CPCC 205706]MDO8200172.1 EAL domain-containing protein [Conexibacter sp. CPCC 205762]MDR9369718.1 EAL domain-containing protein [Conexibacter sp. JD483]